MSAYRFDPTGRTGGVHAFQRAGLGVYPFHCVKVEKREAGCAFCGHPLLYPCVVEDRDGKQFDVGCDCVMRSGDAGLLAKIKNSEAYRELQRQKRAARDSVVQAELETLLADPRLLDWEVRNYRRSLGYCGMTGRARVRKEIKERLERATVRETVNE